MHLSQLALSHGNESHSICLGETYESRTKEYAIQFGVYFVQYFVLLKWVQLTIGIDRERQMKIGLTQKLQTSLFAEIRGTNDTGDRSRGSDYVVPSE